jgi:hypothetical protein
VILFAFFLRRISPEKEELDHVEGPSKEESQMHPGTAAENSGISQETFPDQSLEWVEYERQQITYQLSQLAEQREKLEQQLNQLGSGAMEQPTTAGTYNNYYGGWESQYQYSYPYTSETCYQCRWNGYYNSAYWQTSAADHLSHELQCQHCGYMNKRSENISKASDSVPNEPSNPSPQLFTGTSTLPEMVAHAVSEALKSAGIILLAPFILRFIVHCIFDASCSSPFIYLDVLQVWNKIQSTLAFLMLQLHGFLLVSRRQG